MSIEATTALQQRLQSHLARVQERIDAALARAARPTGSVTLVGVSKTVGRAEVDAAYAVGLRHFGENRVQDAMAKFADTPDDLVLHLIGSLQTNKARQVVGHCGLIHSLDRVDLADALEKQAAKIDVVQSVLIQVNVAREQQKHGCDPDELDGLIESVLQHPHLRLQGLMTMAPLVATPEEARPVFVALRELRDRMQSRYPDASLADLSMGMTNDFDVAVEEGATLVRVGRAIFADAAGS